MSRWRWRRRVAWPSALVMIEAAGFSVVTAAFLALGRVYSLPPIVAFDTAGLRLARELRSPLLDVLAERVTAFGSELLWIVWVPIAVALVLRQRRAAALALMVVAAGVGPWNSLLKSIYHRARPMEFGSGIQAFSFPSGHAMAAGAVFGFLAFLAWRELRGRPRWVAIAGAVGAAVLIALTRPYLGVHYPSDVLAGLLAGVLWADLVVLAWRLGARRLANRPPAGQTALRRSAVGVNNGLGLLDRPNSEGGSP